MTIRRAAGAWFQRLTAGWQVRAALGIGLSGANAIGIAVVYLLAILVVPMPAEDRDHLLSTRSLLLAGLYVVVFGTIGTWQAWRTLHPVVLMLQPDAQPTERDQRDVLAAPRRLFLFQGLCWAVASLLVLGQYLFWSWDLALSIFLIVALAGWTTACLTYLLSERALRPVTRRPSSAPATGWSRPRSPRRPRSGRRATRSRCAVAASRPRWRPRPVADAWTADRQTVAARTQRTSGRCSAIGIQLAPSSGLA